MNGQHFDDADAERARALIATIDLEMSLLPKPATAEMDSLVGSWAELAKLLEWGPAPATRECPICKHTGMREATRCGYCWSPLSPLA